MMDTGGVPAGRIYKAADMLDDPQFKARDSIVEVTDQTFGTLKMQNVVPKLSATPGSIRWTGADLGQFNDQVYGEPAGHRRGRARRARRARDHLTPWRPTARTTTPASGSGAGSGSVSGRPSSSSTWSAPTSRAAR